MLERLRKRDGSFLEGGNDLDPLLISVPISHAPGWSAIAASRPGRDEQPVIAELAIGPTDPQEVPRSGITSRVLRVSIREIYARVMAGDLAMVRQMGGARFDVQGEVRDGPRPGREGRPLAHYAEYAREYLEVINAGSRRPHKDLAKKKGISYHTSVAWIRKARDKGLLEGSAKGKAIGRLSRRALSILENGDHGDQHR